MVQQFLIHLQRDVGLQQLAFHWLMDILDEMPRGKDDYDKWIQDGRVLVKGICNVKHFNIGALCNIPALISAHLLIL